MGKIVRQIAGIHGLKNYMQIQKHHKFRKQARHTGNNNTWLFVSTSMPFWFDIHMWQPCPFDLLSA